jgi:peptide/nickel transport system substrate-binding protein
MKANRFSRLLAAIAAAALTLTGLAAVGTAPASAAAKSTVILHSSGEITSLNSGTIDGNTSYNAQVGSLTGMGFSYYNEKTQLIMNTKFGSMAVTKKTPKDFQIKYTIVAGQKWSDGTPIDAVDLLLSHVLQADKWSKAAGLGDPKTDKPKFNSVGYSGVYADHIVGDPILGDKNMSLTLKFDKPLPDWQLLAPGPSPVHSLVLLAAGKTKLGTAAANLAAKAKFLADFKGKKTASLTAMGNKWTTAYDIQTINASTNPLLLISNGPFKIQSATPKDSMILVLNPLYTSGPAMYKTNPVKKIQIKTIQDDTAAVQALANGDLDIYYNTLVTIAGKASLDAISGVTVLSKVGGNYSHFDLRTDSANGADDSYTGPFAGNSNKAKDLRHAFLLALPRQQMVETVIAPTMPTAKVMDTQFAFTGSPEYNALTSKSGVKQYSVGTQADRTAKALALVKKWYPTASADASKVNVKLLFANTSATRVRLAQLTKAEVAKAGFNLNIDGSDDLFANTSNSAYDAAMFGFGLTAISQSNSVSIYKSTGGNNVWGWNDSVVDEAATSLEGDYLTDAQVTAKRLIIDKRVIANYWGLPLYQNPTVTAWNKALKGVKTAPIGNNITWNVFEWHF